VEYEEQKRERIKEVISNNRVFCVFITVTTKWNSTASTVMTPPAVTLTYTFTFWHENLISMSQVTGPNCGEISSNTLCLKKVPTFILSVTFSNLNRFSQFCTAGKRMKFATKPIQHYPPHLRYVATLPWEIKNSNFWPRVNCACVAQCF